MRQRDSYRKEKIVYEIELVADKHTKARTSRADKHTTARTPRADKNFIARTTRVFLDTLRQLTRDRVDMRQNRSREKTITAKSLWYNSTYDNSDKVVGGYINGMFRKSNLHDRTIA